jgi:catechol 2,3-dioxygenase-like lactoylglutathione lyase family enzyme
MTMADEKLLRVMVAVTEMAKAKTFYAEQLGWTVTTDYGQGERHWVSLSLPGGGATLTLSARLCCKNIIEEALSVTTALLTPLKRDGFPPLVSISFG